MTVAPIELKDVRINLYNDVTPDDVVKATNEGLLKLSDSVADEAKKEAIVNLIKEGKVKEIQIKLGMVENQSLDLVHKADDMFGKKTLENLRAGKVVETNKIGTKKSDGSIENLPSGQITMTKEEYLDYMKPENTEKLIKKNSDGTVSNAESLLYPLRTLTINVSKDFRGDIKTDALTFDFNSNIIKNLDEAKTAFSAVKNVVASYPEPSNVQKNYAFDKQAKIRKTNVTNISPGTNPESSREALVKTSFIGYEDIEEYIDLEMVKVLSEDKNKNVVATLDKKNIKKYEIKNGEGYAFGALTLIHLKNKGREIAPNTTTNYLRRADRSGLKSKLYLPEEGNTLEGCLKLVAMMNLIAQAFKDKITGTDELADIEKDHFGWNTVEDNNPFYVRRGTLYFNDAGSIDDYDLLRQANLDDMVSGITLEDLAKFFTSRVEYKFEG